MPLPDHPLVLNGGCNCGAIRYKINVPAQPERPPNPLSNGESTFPCIATEHSNDSRKATGSILPAYIYVPTTMMSCRIERISESDSSNTNTTESWIPATEMFYPRPGDKEYWLKFYRSSTHSTRTFCGKCGTNLTFSYSPLPEGWPDLFEVILGTIDRSDLEKEWMAPDRHTWVECGINWIMELTNGRPGMPRHPTFKWHELSS